MIICDLRNHKDNSWSENAENFWRRNKRIPFHFFSNLPVDERAYGGFEQKNCWAVSDWRPALSRKHSWAGTNFAAGRLWTDFAQMLTFPISHTHIFLLCQPTDPDLFLIANLASRYLFDYITILMSIRRIWHFKIAFSCMAHIYLRRHRVAGTDTPRHWKSSTNTSQFVLGDEVDVHNELRVLDMVLVQPHLPSSTDEEGGKEKVS